jgi:antitoxin FitA
VATIQIRDIPDDVYEKVRRRARDAGQSLQAYMRDHVVEWGSRPTKAEALAEMREVVTAEGGTGVTVDQIVEALDADRR